MTLVYQAPSWVFSSDADAAMLRKVDYLDNLLASLTIPDTNDKQRRHISMIVTELFNNSLDHGILELPSDLKQSPSGFSEFYELRNERLSLLNIGHINISMKLFIDGGKARLHIHMEDSGKGFTYEALTQDDKIKPFGRGLMIISSLCKSLEYYGKGNEVDAVYEWDIPA